MGVRSKNYVSFRAISGFSGFSIQAIREYAKKYSVELDKSWRGGELPYKQALSLVVGLALGLSFNRAGRYVSKISKKVARCPQTEEDRELWLKRVAV